jgi:hypothetical protein
MDALAAPAFVDEALASLQRRLVGAGDPGRDVDRDDLVAVLEERPVDADEVAHRRLGGGGAGLAAAQPLVEVRVVGRGDLDLGALGALERDVQGDPLDPVLRDQLVRQIRGRVGDDRGLRGGTHVRVLSRGPQRRPHTLRR